MFIADTTAGNLAYLSEFPITVTTRYFHVTIEKNYYTGVGSMFYFF